MKEEGIELTAGNGRILHRIFLRCRRVSGTARPSTEGESEAEGKGVWGVEKRRSRESCQYALCTHAIPSLQPIPIPRFGIKTYAHA